LKGHKSDKRVTSSIIRVSHFTHVTLPINNIV